jgi:preprotein translocase subunit SecG
VVQVIIAVALIGMVLIQRSDSDGFGLGGGSGNNLLSGRSTANLMTRTTAILATLFIVNSLALSVIAARGHAPSLVEAVEKQQAAEPAAPSKKEASKPTVKQAPAVPVDGEVKPVGSEKKPAKKPAAPVAENTDSNEQPND